MKPEHGKSAARPSLGWGWENTLGTGVAVSIPMMIRCNHAQPPEPVHGFPSKPDDMGSC